MLLSACGLGSRSMYKHNNQKQRWNLNKRLTMHVLQFLRKSKIATFRIFRLLCKNMATLKWFYCIHVSDTWAYLFMMRVRTKWTSLYANHFSHCLNFFCPGENNLLWGPRIQFGEWLGFEQDDEPKHRRRVARQFLTKEVPEMIDWLSDSPASIQLKIWGLFSNNVLRKENLRISMN